MCREVEFKNDLQRFAPHPDTGHLREKDEFTFHCLGGTIWGT